MHNDELPSEDNADEEEDSEEGREEAEEEVGEEAGERRGGDDMEDGDDMAWASMDVADGEDLLSVSRESRASAGQRDLAETGRESMSRGGRAGGR